MIFDERPDLVGIAAAIAAVLLALFIIAEDDDQPVSPAYVLNLDTVEPAPDRYIGPATARVMFLATRDVEQMCLNVARADAPPPGRKIAGCAQNRTIVVPDPCEYTDDSYAVLLCHEKAHVKGWRH